MDGFAAVKRVRRIIASDSFSAVMVTSYVIFLAAYNSFANPAVDLGPRVALPVLRVTELLLSFRLSNRRVQLTRDAHFSGPLFLSSVVLFGANVRPLRTGCRTDIVRARDSQAAPGKIRKL
jgi:hypothetical protein